MFGKLGVFQYKCKQFKQKKEAPSCDSASFKIN